MDHSLPITTWSAANIPAEFRAMLLEFSSRPSPYTMFDLDDTEALYRRARRAEPQNAG